MKGWLVVRYPIEGDSGEDFLVTVERYRDLWHPAPPDCKIAVEWERSPDWRWDDGEGSAAPDKGEPEREFTDAELDALAEAEGFSPKKATDLNSAKPNA